MDAELGVSLLHSNGKSSLKGFTTSLISLSAILLIGLALFSEYSIDAASDKHVHQYYSYLSDVYIMIFVGFGFLMTFLKFYSYSAVSFNLLTSCFVILEAILAIGIAQQGLGVVSIDLPLLIDSAFCAGAAMISFGAVLGKATPTQLIWLLALEVPLYAINAQVVADYYGVLDVGGSITIHAFGAFFGIAASYMLSPSAGNSSHPKNGASYTSDITAMIGTVFLFIFWPSFNGALASAPGAPDKLQPQIYCIMNTVSAHSFSIIKKMICILMELIANKYVNFDNV